MKKQNRQAKGEKHPATHLKNIDVLNIVVLKNNKTPNKIIMQKYSISKSTIERIMNGKCWNWLTKTKKPN
jgi:hypothetical protein